jgi:hypothetical protein
VEVAPEAVPSAVVRQVVAVGHRPDEVAVADRPAVVAVVAVLRVVVAVGLLAAVVAVVGRRPAVAAGVVVRRLVSVGRVVLGVSGRRSTPGSRRSCRRTPLRHRYACRTYGKR